MTSLLSPSRQRVSDAISHWRKGHAPDATGFLEQHPEIRAAQSLVIDLAYEEFCLRVEAGEHVDTEKFCGRFPTVKHSLARMLDVHGVLGSKALGLGVETLWPEVGERWLDWELVEPLGRGAFSRVFVAREPRLGHREVVLKCSFAGPHEAFILGSLSHQNIVPVHSSRHDDASGLTGISMPLLGRSTLANVLDALAAHGDAARSAELFRAVADGREIPLSQPGRRNRAGYTDAVVNVVQRVAAGLAAAHRAGVIHGDIKPSNILLSFAAEPMLMDFNLSGGAADGDARLGGTPPYMAPECLLEFLPGHPANSELPPHDPRSDMFSLGVVLLELLLGRIPFKVDLKNPALLPREDDWLGLVRTVDPRLQSVLQRCLSFDRAQRYANAEELVSDLAALEQVKESKRKLSRRLAIGAAVSVLAAVPLSWGTWSWLHYVDPESPAGVMERARQHLQKGELLYAAQVLARLYGKTRNPKLLAWAGYCFAEAGSHDTARGFLMSAARSTETNCGIIWNDSGFCSSSVGKLERAEEELTEALRLTPKLQAAHHNRGLSRLKFAMKDNRPLSLGAWEDFQSALDDDGSNAQLHFDMARALAYAKKRGPVMTERTEDHVVAALVGGIELKAFAAARFFFADLNLESLAREARLSTQHVAPPAPLLLPPPFGLPDASEVA
jgi:serine/threonine protein kinase